MRLRHSEKAHAGLCAPLWAYVLGCGSILAMTLTRLRSPAFARCVPCASCPVATTSGCRGPTPHAPHRSLCASRASRCPARASRACVLRCRGCSKGLLRVPSARQQGSGPSSASLTRRGSPRGVGVASSGATGDNIGAPQAQTHASHAQIDSMSSAIITSRLSTIRQTRSVRVDG